MGRQRLHGAAKYDRTTLDGAVDRSDISVAAAIRATNGAGASYFRPVAQCCDDAIPDHSFAIDDPASDAQKQGRRDSRREETRKDRSIADNKAFVAPRAPDRYSQLARCGAAHHTALVDTD